MPTQKLTQNSFVNGQYDRTAQNQEGLQGGIVASGLSSSLNLVSGDKQEIRKRLGTKRLVALDDVAVIAPYRYGENDIVLAFSDKKLDIYSFQGDNLELFRGADNIEQFVQEWTGNTTNGYTISDSNDSSSLYNIFRSVGVGGSSIGATANGYTITLEVPEVVSLNKFYFKFKTGVAYIPSQGVKKGGYRGFRNAVLFWSDDGAVWERESAELTKPDGSAGVNAYMSLVQSGRPVALVTNSYVIEFNISPKQASSHKYWRVVFSDYSDAEDADESMTYAVSAQVWVQSLSQSSSMETQVLVDALKNIKYDQFGKQMKIASSSSPAYEFSVANGLITFAEYKPENPQDLFADTKFGKPTCVSYFQNRLWFSGFKEHPATVLASKFGDEGTFSAGTTAQFDDYLELTCNQLKNKIDNIVGSQNVLYCFSEDGISFVDGGSGGMIATNQNIEFNLKNRMPAGSATPTFKDDVLLYASADGTKLYAVDYDLIVERFQVEDLAKFAKDITRSKIKELHYLNNESQLIYGLCEDNSMFALMYKKGQYNGFFPVQIQDGYIYDVCPVKVGRNYKLLMITNRSGRWFIEEKLDEGVYVDTSSVLLSNEEKKWATYDNLENNISLDCYQVYENAVSGSFEIVGDVLKTDKDLTEYLTKTIMLSAGVDFVIVSLLDVVDGGYLVQEVARRGSKMFFDMARIEFDTFSVDFASGTEIGVVSQGRYMGEFVVPEDGVIHLPFAVHKVIYGATYISRGIIKIQKPYESMKQVQQMAFSLLNTGHLEVGTSLNDMLELEKIKDDSHLDLTEITMNGAYVVVPSDTPEWEKNIIFQSKKGLPFTINCVEAVINYSDMGGK